ncbi:hypothetical protein Tco_0314022 [Tanacetum coccineum]
MNIKFRGGLLGLKRLHGFLEVTAAQSKPEIVEMRLQSWMNSELYYPIAEQIQMYQWMEEVEVAATKKTLMLLKYLEHKMRLLEEVEVVAMKVETQEEFLSLIQVIVNFMSLVGVVFKHLLLKNFLHINDGQIPKASSKWSLHCLVNCISDYLINRFAHLVENIEIL